MPQHMTDTIRGNCRTHVHSYPFYLWGTLGDFEVPPFLGPIHPYLLQPPVMHHMPYSSLQR